MLTYTLPNNTPPRSYANFLDDLAGTGRARIGLYCGSFNPIHNAHTALCSYLLEKEDLQKILLVVSPRNPLKEQAGLLPEAERLDMARLAAGEVAGVRASDFEFSLPRPSYTWRTLEALRAAFPATAFSLIIGADNWQHFDRWARPDYIRAHHKLLVYPRPGYPLNASALPDGVDLLGAPVFDVSSTRVRKLLRENGDVSRLVPAPVLRYIKERHLYS